MALFPSVGFLPDGKALVSAAKVGPIIVRELATGRELRRFNRVTDHVESALALSASGELLVSSGQLLHLYDTATGKTLGEMKTKGMAHVRKSCAGPRRKIAGNDTVGCGSISIYEKASLRETHHFNQPVEPPQALSPSRDASLTFSPDGKLLASVDRPGGESNKWICLWDPATGKQVRRINGGQAGTPPITIMPSSPTFSPDGKLLAWLDFFGTAHLSDVASGKEVGQFKYAIGVAFTLDSKSLVGYLPNGMGISVWDIERKTTRQVGGNPESPQGVTWIPYTLPRQPIAVSPDGKVLAVGGEQNSVRLFDLDTGCKIYSPAAGIGTPFLGYHPTRQTPKQ